MTQHTPGPWKVTSSPGGPRIYGRSRKQPICVFFMGETDDSYELKNAECNARLIAASPALFLALINCVFALGRGGANQIDGPGRKEWEAARAAIARATGGAQ